MFKKVLKVIVLCFMPISVSMMHGDPDAELKKAWEGVKKFLEQGHDLRWVSCVMEDFMKYYTAPESMLEIAKESTSNEIIRDMIAWILRDRERARSSADTRVLATRLPDAEEAPLLSIKIDVVDRKIIQIWLNGQEVGKLTQDCGLWSDENVKDGVLNLAPLAYPATDDISFELGGVNFKVHLNGDIEVFGSTPVMRCVLECPSEGKLIIPAGKELQVNRFVCMTRGKTIENYGRVAIAEACFCFEQTIINHGEITTLEQPGKPKGVLLLLKSELKSDGGVEDIKSIHLKDRSYPEYGCCCFYGFDRSFLYPSCKHPNYPDTPPTLFVDLHERDFLYPRCNSYVQIPFKGHTKEGDYDVPFTGDAVLVLLASGNHGASNFPEKDFYFRFCESPSGRPFASYSSKVKAKTIGDSLNAVLCCKLPTRFKVYFRGAHFMIYEGSKTYIIPALYFFKL